MPTSRSVLVEPARLPGWLARFEERNGPFVIEPGRTEDHGVGIVAANGCSARLTPPLPGRGPAGGAPAPTDGEAVLAVVLSYAEQLHTVGLVLVRRGGYSVGVARDGQIVSSKTGTRYVQGRTAAGGWSQQRFARRRANQADALVEETAVRAAALFRADPPTCLQPGGDRTLAAAVLAEPVLALVADLPRVPFLTVPDPRFAVLKDAARTALAVRITVTDPPVAIPDAGSAGPGG